MNQVSSSPAEFSGLNRLDQGAYTRWVRGAILIAVLGYGAVTVGDVLISGLAARMYAVTTQSATVVMCVIAFGLTFRGRVGGGALLTILAVWLELHSSLPMLGTAATSLVTFPLLVMGAGLLLGGRGAFMGAALTSVTIPGTILVSRALTGSPPAADGEAYWLVVVVANLFGAAAITHLGVRSFQRVLRAAQANEQRLADLVSHAPDGIIAADGEGLVITANPAAERILGVEAPALRGRSLSRVLGGAADGAEERSRVDALLRSRGGQPVSTRLRSRRGRVAWVDATVTGMPWADGTSGMQVTLRDMTEKRQSEEAQRMLQAQLEHALRLEAVGRLAGGVAHDFNNLLTVIGGAAELLLVESEEGENELAREILEAKIRGAALTKQLLSFARKDMVQPTRLSLNHVVRDMESLLSRFLTEGIQLTLDLDAPTPPVMADRPQLEQIVVNLVINAKDAIDGQGNVRITVSPPEATRGWETTRWTVPPGTVEVTVEDDGAGMDEDTAGRVFEPFFTTKPRGRGTGLGLATVHGVVGHNGGRVRLLSEAGVGTAVVVEWPVAPSP